MDDAGREALLEYILRPSVAQERVTRGTDGLVPISLKKPFADGTVAVDMDPLSLLSRLAASVPPPKFHTAQERGCLEARHVAFEATSCPRPPIGPNSTQCRRPPREPWRRFIENALTKSSPVQPQTMRNYYDLLTHSWMRAPSSSPASRNGAAKDAVCSRLALSTPRPIVATNAIASAQRGTRSQNQSRTVN